jgi:hypothetical protein
LSKIQINGLRRSINPSGFFFNANNAEPIIFYSGYPLDSTTHYYLWTMKSVMAGFILTACCTRR